MLYFKAGVTIKNLQPQMALAVQVIESVYTEHGVTTVITSGSDGQHSMNSLHYVGRALDFRTRQLGKVEAEAVARDIRDRLTDEYDVVLESDHIHVEYDPK